MLWAHISSKNGKLLRGRQPVIAETAFADHVSNDRALRCSAFRIGPAYGVANQHHGCPEEALSQITFAENQTGH